MVIASIINFKIDYACTCLESKGLDLSSSIPNDIQYEIETDGNRLRQILINLVSNAIKFTSEGFVEIKLSAMSKMSQFQFKILELE